jgi:hypothetical protein
MTPGAVPATRQAALDFTINREVRLHDEPHRHWWGKFKSLSDAQGTSGVTFD